MSFILKLKYIFRFFRLFINYNMFSLPYLLYIAYNSFFFLIHNFLFFFIHCEPFLVLDFCTSISHITLPKCFPPLPCLSTSPSFQDRGRYRGVGGHSLPSGGAPPLNLEFFFYFQNSFSIACLRERNFSAKQEKYLS